MLPQKALRISLRGVDGRISMESLHTSIDWITAIPTARVLVLSEDEIIDDGWNGKAQHHGEEEHVTTDDDEDENEDPAHLEPEMHTDDIFSMLNDDDNKVMKEQNRMLLKLLFEQQGRKNALGYLQSLPQSAYQAGRDFRANSIEHFQAGRPCTVLWRSEGVR